MNLPGQAQQRKKQPVELVAQVFIGVDQGDNGSGDIKDIFKKKKRAIYIRSHLLNPQDAKRLLNYLELACKYVDDNFVRKHASGIIIPNLIYRGVQRAANFARRLNAKRF